MSFQDKGRRESIRRQAEDIQARMDKFNKSLYYMNAAYHLLVDDATLTKENLVDKLAALSDYKFNDFELGLLIDDLCKK